MDSVPLTVTIPIPTRVDDRKGVYATTGVNGIVTTVRSPRVSIAEIDKAVDLIDPTMSRSMFITLAAEYVAKEVIKHNKEYLKYVEEYKNVRNIPTG